MFYYEITESQRADLLHMLEWAEWAINEHLSREEGKPWAEHLSAEKSACGYLWDTLNQMQPSDVCGEPEEYDEVTEEMRALFQKGE